MLIKDINIWCSQPVSRLPWTQPLLIFSFFTSELVFFCFFQHKESAMNCSEVSLGKKAGLLLLIILGYCRLALRWLLGPEFQGHLLCSPTVPKKRKSSLSFLFQLVGGRGSGKWMRKAGVFWILVLQALKRPISPRKGQKGEVLCRDQRTGRKGVAFPPFSFIVLLIPPIDREGEEMVFWYQFLLDPLMDLFLPWKFCFTTTMPAEGALPFISAVHFSMYWGCSAKAAKRLFYICPATFCKTAGCV